MSENRSQHPSSNYSTIPRDITLNRPPQETSASHPCPNLTYASPLHTTVYLPPRSQHGNLQKIQPDIGTIYVEGVQEQYKPTASDLPFATYPSTLANPTSIPVTIATTTNTVLALPLRTCPDTYNPYNAYITQTSPQHPRPITTTQTSTHRPFPAPCTTTTPTPTHSLTSASLSLLNSTTSPHDQLSHFLFTPPTGDPWNSVTYHARPPRVRSGLTTV